MKSAEWWAENWGNHELVKAEARACFEANNAEPEPISSREVLREIKRIHAEGGRRLSVDDVIVFIGKNINLGRSRPYVLNTGKRGRPFRKTPYDVAYERRRGLYQRFVRLPAGIRRDSGSSLSKQIKAMFVAMAKDGIARRRQVQELTNKLMRMRIAPPTERQLRKLRASSELK